MDIKTTIKTGSYEIIDSGQIICLTGEKTIFELTNGASTIIIDFLFKTDENKSRVEGKTISDTEIEMTFFNFENSLGQGNTTPLRLGLFSGKELYMSYRIYSLDEKTLRTIDYTFYAK